MVLLLQLDVERDPDGVVGVTRGSGGPETVAIVPVVVAVVEVERVQPHLKEIQSYSSARSQGFEDGD